MKNIPSLACGTPLAIGKTITLAVAKVTPQRPEQPHGEVRDTAIG